MDGLRETSIKNVCCTCLSTERNLSQLCRIDDGVNNLFFLLSYKSEAYEAMFVKDVTQLFICWECTATIQRLVRFREQACVAQTKLTDIVDGKINYSKIKCLSKLSYFRQTEYHQEISIKVETENFVDCGPKISNMKVETPNDSDEVPLAQLRYLKSEVVIDSDEIGDNYDDEDAIDSSAIKKSNNDKTTVKNKDTATPIIKYRNNVISSSINMLEELVDCVDIEKTKNIKRRHSLADIRDNKETDQEIVVKSEIEKSKSKRKVNNKNMEAYNVNIPISSGEKNDKFNEKQNLDDGNIVSFTTKKSQSETNGVRHRDLEPVVLHKKAANDKSYERFNIIQMTEGEMVKSIEMRKLEDDYVNGLHKCESCIETFEDSDSLEKHISDLHERQSEDKLLNSKPRQQPKHGAKLKVLIDDPQGAGFACVECNKYFKNKKGRNDHIQKFHRDGYQCATCGKKFPFTSTLRRHELTNCKSLPRERCSVCGKTVRAELAKEHAEMHASGKEYACVACDKKFMTRSYYEKHLKYARSHVDREGFKHKCSVCGKDHRSPAQLRDHYNFAHMGKTQHKCPICDKALATRRSVTMHVRRIHNGVKEKVIRDHICQTCGKGFTYRRYLKQHELIHTGERPLTCNICGRSFRQKAGLYIHKRLVHKVALKKKAVHTDEIIVPDSEINKNSD